MKQYTPQGCPILSAVLTNHFLIFCLLLSNCLEGEVTKSSSKGNLCFGEFYKRMLVKAVVLHTMDMLKE